VYGVCAVVSGSNVGPCESGVSVKDSVVMGGVSCDGGEAVSCSFMEEVCGGDGGGGWLVVRVGVVEAVVACSLGKMQEVGELLCVVIWGVVGLGAIRGEGGVGVGDGGGDGDTGVGCSVYGGDAGGGCEGGGGICWSVVGGEGGGVGGGGGGEGRGSGSWVRGVGVKISAEVGV